VMARLEPPFLVVGHIKKVHGTKGEVFVRPLTDHPESTFAPGVILYLGDEGGDGPDPTWPSVAVEGVRPFRNGFLLRFPGLLDRTGAEALQGRYLFRPRSDLEALEEGELFYHQLLGMKVVTTTGEEVGEVVEVFELQPADLLQVRGPVGTHHIPFLKSIVRGVDVENGVLVVDLPEGLLDLA
jgi:16S rRNA processing protein RimM